LPVQAGLSPDSTYPASQRLNDLTGYSLSGSNAL
jgi:hypothetical protein